VQRALWILVVASCAEERAGGGLIKNAKDASAEASSGDASIAIDVSCTNGVKDGTETDVDCGGSTCPRCENGRACSTGGDCVSVVCADQTCSGDLGCSDGTREGFESVTDFPNIAACSGGWSVPGLLAGGTKMPVCGRVSGNDSGNPTGANCNVADLCQTGWHVCATPAEFAAKRGAGGCLEATVLADSFFVTRQSGSGSAECGAGANDLFGCGSAGIAAGTSCAPLDRSSNDRCRSLPSSWSCGDAGTNEANVVTKAVGGGGGVLCCRD
jgi:hypothetical protein